MNKAKKMLLKEGTRCLKVEVDDFKGFIDKEPAEDIKTAINLKFYNYDWEADEINRYIDQGNLHTIIEVKISLYPKGSIY